MSTKPVAFVDGCNVAFWDQHSDLLQFPTHQYKKVKKPRVFECWHLSAICQTIEQTLNAQPKIFLPQTYLSRLTVTNNDCSSVIIKDPWVLFILHLRNIVSSLPTSCNDDEVCLKEALAHNTYVISNDKYRDHVNNEIVSQHWLEQHKLGFYLVHNAQKDVNNTETDCFECKTAALWFEHLLRSDFDSPVYRTIVNDLYQCKCLLKCRGRIELSNNTPVFNNNYNNNNNQYYTSSIAYSPVISPETFYKLQCIAQVLQMPFVK